MQKINFEVSFLISAMYLGGLVSFFISLVVLTGLTSILDIQLGLTKWFTLFSNKNDLIISNSLMTTILILFIFGLVFFYLGFRKLLSYNKSVFTHVHINKYSKIILNVFTILLVLFGFLPLFISMLSVKSEVSNSLNQFAMLICLGGLFPYAYLLIFEGKESITNKDDSIPESLSSPNDSEENLLRENKANNYLMINVFIGVLLLIIVSLIFYMLQEGFGFSNIIDLKTILGSLATLFGAFLGASLAGKYAIKAANKQIDFSIEQDVLNKKSIEKKYLLILSAKSILIVNTFNYLIQFLNKNKDTNSKIDLLTLNSYKKDLLNYSVYFLDPDLEKLNYENLEHVLIIQNSITLFIIDIEGIQENIEFLDLDKTYLNERVIPRWERALKNIKEHSAELK